ncbi:hypothetical protein C7E17_26635, partial [Stenotrophomonas maltophilia]
MAAAPARWQWCQRGQCRSAVRRCRHACAAFATARARQLDRQWLQRQLDGSGASEDSADLLFADAAT